MATPETQEHACHSGRGDNVAPVLRTCAFSRAELPDEKLLRFVAGPAGEIVPDVDRKLPGRGVWLTLDRNVVEQAAKRGCFSRGLKSKVSVPDGLPELIDRLLLQKVVSVLSLANKAGLLVTGFGKVDRLLGSGTASVLISGQDAAEDGRAKLERKFRAVQKDCGLPAPHVTILSSDEIGLAIGRSGVVHAALTSGGLTDRFLREARRLQCYRATPDAFDQADCS